MVIESDTSLTNKQTAPPNELASFTVNPDIVILTGFGTEKRNVHAFDYTTTLRCGKEKRPEINFGLCN